MSKRWTERLLALAILGLLLIAWSGYISWRDLSPLVLPGPLATGQTLLKLLRTPFGWAHIGTTLIETLGGFLLGSLLGIGLGTLAFQSPAAQRILRPYLIASQAMPKLALAPLLIIWLGYGLTPKIVIAALICFFPLFENTLTGLQSVDRGQIELFQALRATRYQTFRHLLFPAALPLIFTGLRVAAVLGLVGAVVGEFVGANRGLGALIISAQGTLDTPTVLAAFLLLTFMGMALYGAVALAERLILGDRY